MVWMGDSHSGHFAAGLDSVMVKKHDMKVHISALSCLVLPDVVNVYDLCKANTDSIFKTRKI